MASVLKIGAKVDLRGTEKRLDALEAGLGAEVGEVKRKAATLIAKHAKGYVPQTKYPSRRGGLAASLEGRPQGVVSVVPQGRVHEFGGTIAPRGHPIRIRASHMAERGGEQAAPEVELLLKHEINGLLERLF